MSTVVHQGPSFPPLISVFLLLRVGLINDEAIIVISKVILDMRTGTIPSQDYRLCSEIQAIITWLIWAVLVDKYVLIHMAAHTASTGVVDHLLLGPSSRLAFDIELLLLESAKEVSIALSASSARRDDEGFSGEILLLIVRSHLLLWRSPVSCPWQPLRSQSRKSRIPDIAGDFVIFLFAPSCFQRLSRISVSLPMIR